MSGYRKVSLSDLPSAPSPAREKLELDEAVGASAFGVNVYRADPGEQLPWGYHRHPDHEELFLVLEGALVVETPEREYRVETGEAFFVPRDHRNRARVVGDAPARVVAVGAPKSSDDAIIEEECPTCGTLTRRQSESVTRGGERVYVLRCVECGEETAEIR